MLSMYGQCSLPFFTPSQSSYDKKGGCFHHLNIPFECYQVAPGKRGSFWQANGPHMALFHRIKPLYDENML